MKVYAGDFVLLVEDRNVHDMGQKASRALRSLADWSEDQKLYVCPEKIVGSGFRSQEETQSLSFCA